MTRKSEITIEVELDENNLPINMNWKASDATSNNASTKAFMLSLWDAKVNNTLKIDLWTKDMSVEEMKQFFHQTLLTMADTFQKATGETKICEDLRDYCYHFAKKMDIIPK